MEKEMNDYRTTRYEAQGQLLTLVSERRMVLYLALVFDVSNNFWGELPQQIRLLAFSLSLLGGRGAVKVGP